ncbi:hypothetical protein TcBrA4_0029510 [Trypanosoma cruzi]|nr:hypothetical protein TcBrA4_0029510 [Trypanosoma cruzi]
MLHEAYAPEDTRSVAWSRQKKVAFLSLISGMRDGTRPPGVLLLYGPTGSGKLTSVRAMLREQRDAVGRPLLVEVLHSCESTPQQYYSFLMDTFTEHQLAGNDPCESHLSASSVSGDDSSDVKGRAQRPCEAQSRQQPRVVARLMKLYGESLISPLHARTLRFLDHYDAWRRAEFLGNCTGDGPNALDGSILRRHFVLFVLTTHDTHSDKVALGKLLPSRVLTHPCIYSFHCTPITTRNLTIRVKDVLRMEKRRQTCGVRCHISDEHVDFVCEHSNGDIRQALLQVQWRCLLGERGLNEAAFLSTSAGTPKKKGPRPKLKKPKNVMDLVDDHENVSAETCTLQSSLAPENGFEEEVEKAVLFRDEYLDVAHATARVLTQKYTVSSVAKELSIQPEKLFSYMTNNMPIYFRPDQMQEYAVCAAAASTADAMRSAELFGRRRQTGAELHTARLASDDDSDGMGVIGLDLMALVLFGKTYEVCHKDVCIPAALVAQRPPPYQPMAYPRLRDVEPTRKRFRNDGGGYIEDEFGRKRGRGEEHKVDFTEQEWRQEFLRRIEPRAMGGGSWQGADADILRETLPALVNRCASLETVLLEYAPYARCIVLDWSPPTASRGVLDGNATALSSNVESFKKRPVETSFKPPGPKKTLFSFAERRAPSLQKRPCLLLRYKILCCGLVERPPVRAEHFFIVKRHDDNGDDGDDLLDDAASDPNAPLPLLPDGEDIEEYDD